MGKLRGIGKVAKTALMTSESLMAEGDKMAVELNQLRADKEQWERLAQESEDNLAEARALLQETLAERDQAFLVRDSYRKQAAASAARLTAFQEELQQRREYITKLRDALKNVVALLDGSSEFTMEEACDVAREALKA